MAAQPAPRAALMRRARRRLRVMTTLLALAAVAGLIGWGWIKTHPADDPTAGLLTATVTRGDLIETVSATGSVTAQTGAEVHIGSQITGTIKHLYADIGTHVRAGQVIAELDLPDIKAQLDQSEAGLAAARTRLAQQRSGVGMTKTQLEQAVVQARAARSSARSRLASADAAARLQAAQTPTDIARARSAVAAAAATLSTANSNLAQAQASANLQVANAQEQLTQAQANAGNSSLTLARNRDLLTRGFVAASIVDAAQAADAVNQSLVSAAQKSVQLVREQVTAGLQSARDQVTQAQQGETLAAGLSAPTLIVVADLNRLQVDAFVDETDIGRVRVGQEADITVDAFPKRVFKGSVVKIASGSTIQQGVITYDTTIALDSPEHRLKPDMTASAVIQTGRRTNVLLAPSEAVKAGRRGATVSVLVRKDGKPVVESRRVRTGGSDGVNTEIRAGLKENETIVLAGMEQNQRLPGSASPFGPGGGRRR